MSLFLSRLLAPYRSPEEITVAHILSKAGYACGHFGKWHVGTVKAASLMSSRYGSELGITDWLHPEREPEDGRDPAVVTWPEVLQASGYVIGLVGKWHLGLPNRFHPTKTGFDYFMGFRSGGSTPADPVLKKDGKEQPFKGFTPDILTDHAIEFLRGVHDHPFLLALHFRAPHASWLPVAEEDWAPLESLDPTLPHSGYPKLDVERVKRMTREYLASVRSVDRNLGRLLRAFGRNEPDR